MLLQNNFLTRRLMLTTIVAVLALTGLSFTTNFIQTNGINQRVLSSLGTGAPAKAAIYAATFLPAMQGPVVTNPGSVLVFPYYTSTTDGSKETLITVNNSSAQPAILHLFYVVGCAPTESYATLAPNASRTFSMAAESAGQTGYLIVVAVDGNGNPIQSNNFTGQATLRDGDYVGNYDAEVFRANSATPAAINGNGTATLHFNGTGYDQVAGKYIPTIKSPVDVAGQKIVTVGMAGSITNGTLSGASQVGVGIVRASTGRVGSFISAFTGQCQASGIIADRFPRTPSGLNVTVPSSATATVEFNVGGGTGLMLTPQTAPGGAKIISLPKATMISANLTIPVSRPAGSLLVFPYYTSSPSDTSKNTTIVIRNLGADVALLHLFFINDTCSQSDMFANVAPYGCASFSMAEFDPGSNGYLLVVAVSSAGTPIQFNQLRGQARVSDGDYEGAYEAEVFRANSASPATIDNTLYLATLNFDGTGYDQMPNRFTANIQSSLEVPDQKILTVGMKGNLSSGTINGAAQSSPGTITNSSGNAVSFADFLTAPCQSSGIISNTNPSVVGTMATAVPGGVTATMDFFIGGGLGLQFTPITAVGGAKIIPLQKTGFINSTLTIPISPTSGTDSPTNLSINSVAVAEGDSGITDAVFTVTLTGSSGDCPVTVDYDLPASTSGDYNAAHGKLIFTAATTTQTIIVPINGDRTVESNEQFAVTLSKAYGATINQAIGIGTITNDDASYLSISDVNVTEGNSGTTNAIFQISLSAPVDQAISLTAATSDGTATLANADYVNASRVITFPAGAAATIPYTVIVNGDTAVELNETFSVNLVTGRLPLGVSVNRTTGTGTILNDDAGLSISDVTIAEGDSGTTNAIFTVNLSGISPTPITVNYVTANGTATVTDNDYISTSGTLTFPAGTSTSQTISVPVNGDATLETDETFFVRLSNPVGATLLDAEGIGTITTDDVATLSINDVTVAEGPSGTSGVAVFTLSLSKPVSIAVNGNVIVSDGTATAPGDYLNLPIAFSFSPGDRSKSITIPINGDNVVEANETFSASLAITSGHPNLSLGQGVGVGTISNDDAATIAIDKVIVTEGNSGSVNATFNVSLSEMVDRPVTINFQTADLIATTANNDYTAKTGSVTFPANSTAAQTIDVGVTGDTLTEINETFKVELTANSLPYPTISIAAEPGIGTIINDDTNTLPTITTVPLSTDIVATFSAVQGGGVTVATPVAPPTAQALPTGFVVDGLNRAYDIKTTATFTGPVVVTFKAPNNISPEQFALLRVLHGENGQLIDRTILAPEVPAPNFATREISARVNSFSPFILAISESPQKRPNVSPGSILVFPYYTSKASSNADTRITISNIGTTPATVHLFFIDGANCNQADFFGCLTPNASLTLNTSEYDPENTGWFMAVAVNSLGNPVKNNNLIGNAFVNTSEFVDNYAAESFWANSSAVAALNGDGTATLRFDGSSYEQMPNQFVAEIQSPLSVAGQKIVTIGMSGDLTQGTLTGAGQVGIGVAYNGDERAASFSGFLAGKCQASNVLTNTIPRVPGTLGGLIPKGQVGTIKFNTGGGVGLIMTPKTNKWSGIRGLHKTGLTSTSLTIPVFVPVC